MYEHGSGMWFGGGLMWLFWLLIIVAVVLLVRLIIRGLSPTSTDSALEILKKRYARGEISEEEYEQRKNKLLS